VKVCLDTNVLGAAIGHGGVCHDASASREIVLDDCHHGTASEFLDLAMRSSDVEQGGNILHARITDLLVARRRRRGAP
jgi:hypothetical protein